MAPENSTIGGVSLRVSMIRELHEISSIGAGDDTAAVNLTDATVKSTGSEEGEIGGSSSRMLQLPSAIKAVTPEYSGREDAVAAGLADLSVSTVGDAADGTLSTSHMAAATEFAASSTAAKTATREGKTDPRSDFSGRQPPATWDDIVSSTGQPPADSSEGIGSPSPFASPPSFSSSPFGTAQATDETAPYASRSVVLDSLDEEQLAADDDEAARLALARLTEKVATLSSINARLEEQLQEEEATAQETATGPHICICRAAVTELLDFDPQAPRIVRNIEVNQIVHVEQVCATQAGQMRGRLRDGGWVSMVNRQGVLQFRPMG